MAAQERKAAPAPAPKPTEEHSAPIKTPGELIVIVLAAFLIPVIGLLMIVEFVTGGQKLSPRASTASAIEDRIKPLGQLLDATGASAAPIAAPVAPVAPPTAVAAAAPAAEAPVAAAPSSAADGAAVYQQSCAMCHATGAAGAPKTGDKAAWAPRIQTGKASLYQSALKGKNAMLPKGGNPSLSDAAVKSAVDYLVAQAK
jgi:cytochrome c5